MSTSTLRIHPVEIDIDDRCSNACSRCGYGGSPGQVIRVFSEYQYHSIWLCPDCCDLVANELQQTACELRDRE